MQSPMIHLNLSSKPKPTIPHLPLLSPLLLKTPTIHRHLLKTTLMPMNHQMPLTPSRLTHTTPKLIPMLLPMIHLNLKETPIPTTTIPPHPIQLIPIKTLTIHRYQLKSIPMPKPMLHPQTSKMITMPMLSPSHPSFTQLHLTTPQQARPLSIITFALSACDPVVPSSSPPKPQLNNTEQKHKTSLFIVI